MHKVARHCTKFLADLDKTEFPPVDGERYDLIFLHLLVLVQGREDN